MAPERWALVGLGYLLTGSFVLQVASINFEKEGIQDKLGIRLPHRVGRRRPMSLHRLCCYNLEFFHKIYLYKDQGPRIGVVWFSLILAE